MVDTVKFSDDADASGPLNGDEKLIGLVPSGADFLNRNFPITLAQTLVSANFSDLPAAATAGAGAMRFVPDGPGENGCAAISDGTNWILFALPVYDFGMFYPGTPPGGGNALQKIAITRDISIPANMSGAIGDVGTAPAAQFDITVKDDGTDIGTISIDTNGDFTFTTVSGTGKDVASGSIITFNEPMAADGNIADITLTIPALLALGV